MKPFVLKCLAALLILGLIGLGLWLWYRAGLAIWLESAIAFCL